MKISDRTLDVLKSFSAINQSIAIHPGNQIKTVSPQSTILATANVAENFDNSFAIYDLAQFLAIVNMGSKDCDFVFDDKHVSICSEKHTTKYTYCAPELIKQPPAKNIKLPDQSIAEFKINGEMLKTALQAATVLQVPNLAFIASKPDFDMVMLLQMVVFDQRNPTGTSWSHTIGQYDITSLSSSPFKSIFNVENLLVMIEDYTVQIFSEGICRMFNDSLEYIIALEHSSTEGT